MTSSSEASATVSGFFERHGRAVRRYLYRATRDPSTADDLSQEVFLRIVRAIPRYEPRERERAWIFRIAHNVLHDFQRRRASSLENAAPTEVSRVSHQNVGVDVNVALENLPAEDRDALLLGEVAGLTYAEIATLTGSTVPAVRSRIYRARQVLRERLVPPVPVLTVSFRGTDHE